jgi:hypothetical protein
MKEQSTLVGVDIRQMYPSLISDHVAETEMIYSIQNFAFPVRELATARITALSQSTRYGLTRNGRYRVRSTS